MKICLFISASLIGSLATCALAQSQSDPSLVVDAMSIPTGYAASTGLPGASCACENDCQIHWGTFPKGCLWDNYCLEKRWCSPPPGRRVSSEALFVLPPAPHYQMACRPRLRPMTRPGRVERERILSFELFFELLGWHECTCCPHRGTHRGACCESSSVKTPQWEDPPVPVAEPEPAIAVPVPEAEPAIAPEAVIQSESVIEPAAAPPAVPEPVTEPGVPAKSEPEADDPPPPLPSDPGMPDVPRNTIPQVDPIPVAPHLFEPVHDDRSLLHRKNDQPRVFLAGRLSDYIQTR